MLRARIALCLFICIVIFVDVYSIAMWNEQWAPSWDYAWCRIWKVCATCSLAPFESIKMAVCSFNLLLFRFRWNCGNEFVWVRLCVFYTRKTSIHTTKNSRRREKTNRRYLWWFWNTDSHVDSMECTARHGTKRQGISHNEWCECVSAWKNKFNRCSIFIAFFRDLVCACMCFISLLVCFGSVFFHPFPLPWQRKKRQEHIFTWVTQSMNQWTNERDWYTLTLTHP